MFAVYLCDVSAFLHCSVNVCDAASNYCQQKVCSHLCLPKQGYPHFTCACPNNNGRIRYTLDSRRLQCIVIHIPAPGERANVVVSAL